MYFMGEMGNSCLKGSAVLENHFCSSRLSVAGESLNISKPRVLKIWSLHQQQQNPLGTQKRICSGPTLTHWIRTSQVSCFNFSGQLWCTLMFENHWPRFDPWALVIVSTADGRCMRHRGKTEKGNQKSWHFSIQKLGNIVYSVAILEVHKDTSHQQTQGHTLLY